jgi:hypothetical protein
MLGLYHEEIKNDEERKAFLQNRIPCGKGWHCNPKGS